MNGWYAALGTLLLLVPRAATAADDLTGAARELAQRSVAFAGKGAPISASWRNLSSLGSAELGRAQAAFEAAVEAAGSGVRPLDSPLQARITLSENPLEYLLVEEAQKGEERQVWFAGWKRAGSSSAATPAATLDKKLLWAQDEQILDAAAVGDGMIVLSPANLTWFSRQNDNWVRAISLPLPEARGWPRDLRGRLRIAGSMYQVYLPALTCSGASKPPVTLDCRESDDPWLIESGNHGMLLANYAAARNHFDGRITTQTGQRRAVAPFYSAAAIAEQGKTLWILAMLDGRARIFDGSFEPVGDIDSWGSDIAGTEARCGAGSQVLASRPGDAETDAVQAFSIVNRMAAPLTPPAELPGPVTALWASGGTSAVAVVKNAGTGRYEAYLVTVVCGK